MEMEIVNNDYIVGLLYRIKCENDINDEDIAKRLGMSRVTLNKRRKGKSEWKASELSVISEMTHVPVTNLLKEVSDGGD
jgi:transcriptional regulator with XRE-family HTH domain